MTSMAPFLKTKKLEIIVFISGAVVMILEMVGSRVFGPYLGSSIYTWTGLIGVIMGSLSLGYYWGGKLADKDPNYKTLSIIILCAGASVFLMNVLKDSVSQFVSYSFSDPKVAIVFASSLLFFIPSALLGMVTPYAVKLRLVSLQKSASTVGSLYAISTVGSIFGTFLTGFYLLSYLGTSNILSFLSITLVILSIFTYASGQTGIKLLLIFISLASFGVNRLIVEHNKKHGFVDVDTMYNRVWIVDGVNKADGRPIRSMFLNKQEASAMYLDKNAGMVFTYHRIHFNLIKKLRPDFKSAVVLGGAAYSFPKELVTEFPDATVDVVEIDPDLTKLAIKYFGLEVTPRLRVFHEDGRVFLNKNQIKYDLVFMDAFNSRISIPPHLTTKEAVERMHDALSSNGVLVTNIVSAVYGDYSGFFKSEYLTYKSVFPRVLVYKVHPVSLDLAQNLVLVAFKNGEQNMNPQELGELILDSDSDQSEELTAGGTVLTDEFSPVEKYFFNIM